MHIPTYNLPTRLLSVYYMYTAVYICKAKEYTHRYDIIILPEKCARPRLCVLFMYIDSLLRSIII